MANTLADLLTLLRHSGGTMSFAESCTGGLLSSIITQQPGVSDIFLGSVVSYSNGLKEKMLGVNGDSLRRYGAVSEEVAREMALGALSRMESTWSVAITGIAGPTGGTPEKPVGLVCFAVGGPAGTSSQTQHFTGSRVEIQQQAAAFAVEFLLRSMQKKN